MEVDRVLDWVTDTTFNNVEHGAGNALNSVQEVQEWLERELCAAGPSTSGQSGPQPSTSQGLSSSNSDWCRELVLRAFVPGGPGPSTSGGSHGAASLPLDHHALDPRLALLRHEQKEHRCYQELVPAPGHSTITLSSSSSSSSSSSAPGSVNGGDDREERQQQWAQLVDMARRYSLDENVLMQQLDLGLESFRNNFSRLWDTLVEHCPAVYRLLLHAAHLGVTFAECADPTRSLFHPKGPPGWGKRSVMARAMMRAPTLQRGSNDKKTMGRSDDKQAMGQECDALLDMTKVTPSFEICDEEDFGPPCSWIEVPAGQCVTLPTNNASSIQYDEAAGSCTLYDHDSCQGRSLEFEESVMRFPTGRETGHWNNRGRSIRCRGRPDKSSPSKAGASGVSSSRPSSSSPSPSSSPLPNGPCENVVDQLWVRFQLGRTGSRDPVEMVINGKAFRLTEADSPPVIRPQRGIKLRDAFGSDQVALRDIKLVGIQATAKSNPETPATFSFLSLRMLAECAGTHETIYWHEFADINSGNLTRQAGKVSQVVWSTPISPGNWVRDTRPGSRNQEPAQQSPHPKAHDEHKPIPAPSVAKPEEQIPRPTVVKPKKQMSKPPVAAHEPVPKASTAAKPEEQIPRPPTAEPKPIPAPPPAAPTFRHDEF
ncbi:hypothetical protein JDV02_004769 [Purpureocillium takamizusanense]|uniref:Uncharacterized protein n=1 Tax=Purpureocillium takamizusanense TaxID=2060973 RepID=A0A9Q8QH13_9HYPO|nr:uncharacterized protein JDV02_004769 [Purpureocillium takamizusanense]UNI18502.1 hypothetical protein JDV02_004769 [Purpureocillium takamizusanense]